MPCMAPSLILRAADRALDLRAEILYGYRHSMDLLPVPTPGLPLAALLVVLDAGCAPVKRPAACETRGGLCAARGEVTRVNSRHPLEGDLTVRDNRSNVANPMDVWRGFFPNLLGKKIWRIQTGFYRGVVRDKHPEIGAGHLLHDGEPAPAVRRLQQLVFQDFRLRDLGITCAPDMI